MFVFESFVISKESWDGHIFTSSGKDMRNEVDNMYVTSYGYTDVSKWTAKYDEFSICLLLDRPNGGEDILIAFCIVVNAEVMKQYWGDDPTYNICIKSKHDGNLCNVWYIDCLCKNPKYKNVAKEAISSLESLASEKSISVIIAHVDKNIPRLCKYYESLGYEIIECPGIEEYNSIVIHMEKKIL